MLFASGAARHRPCLNGRFPKRLAVKHKFIFGRDGPEPEYPGPSYYQPEADRPLTTLAEVVPAPCP